MNISIETSEPTKVKNLFQKEELKNISISHGTPSCFLELLNYLKLLWSENYSIEINALNNITLLPQRMFNSKILNEKEYNIYTSLFNNKSYLPDIIIILYDDNTQLIEDIVNDPFFKIQVYKIQYNSENIEKNISNLLKEINSKFIQNNSKFAYFEKSYSNYNSIDNE